MSGLRSLARNHDFTLLWTGQVISQLGSRASMFVFPLLTYAMTGSLMLAALSQGLHIFGEMAALLPAGVLADRVHRLRLLRGTSTAGAVLYASLVGAALLDELTIAHLLVVALLTGVGAGLFSPAELSAVRAVVPREDLPAALSQNQAREHVASLVGAPLGGALYGVTRWLPFAADAISFAASYVLLGRIRTDLSAPARSGPRRNPVKDLTEGVHFVARHRFFRVLVVWASLTNLVVNAVFFLAILRLVQAHYPAWQIGLVETATGVSGILGALAAPRIIDRFATGWLTISVAWSFVPVVVPLMLWNNPLAVATATALVIFLNPAGNAGIGAYRIAVTPEELTGRVQSCMHFVSMAAMPLAPVMAGALLAGLGGVPALAILGVTTALVALIPLASSSIRAVPRPAEWDTTGATPEPAPAATSTG